MLTPANLTRHRSRWRGELTLALALSAGVVGFMSLVNTVFGQAPGGSDPGPRGILIATPIAIIAVFLGLRLTSRMGLDRPGPAAALNKAAVVSLIFTVLLAPATLLMPSVGTTLADGAIGAGSGVGGELVTGLASALLGQVAGLPILFVALALIGYFRVSDSTVEAEKATPRARLPRFFYIASAAAVLGVYGASSGVAVASIAQGAETTSTSSSNPCATAPHDTFNVSAINMTMILNRFGVNDPNAEMYVLNQNIAAVRAEDAAGTVSSGLQGNDAIQPLVIRAHMGDCVTVNFTNATTFGLEAFDQSAPSQVSEPCTPVTATNPDGTTRVVADCAGSLAHTAPQNLAWNVDGLPAVGNANQVSSDVGQNSDNTAAPGQTVSYTVYMDPALGYGAHVFHSTGDYHMSQVHGLFGVLVSEPVGSSWLDPHTLQPEASGWDAVIQMPSGQTSFREFNLIYHEIGNEGYRQIDEAPGTTCQTKYFEVLQPDGECELPVVDPFTSGYRPCSKAMNYRSECFFERELTQIEHGIATPDESQDYGSYTNGDMATPRPEAYVGDPYKILLTNAGSEMGHVFHEHGGAIRWLRNPGAANPDISGGLEKFPPVTKASIRLDSQTIEPGESYDLETECGAGGCQQAAGDFLYHCHIAAHYDAGMVSFIRVFDTLQSSLATVPGRTPKPAGVTSDKLLGLTIGGKKVVLASQLTDPSTQVSLESLVEGQLPPQGVPSGQEDATVWNWVKGGTSTAPVYMGEPESTFSWADYTPPNPGQRDPILFDPSNGRYAWPLLQPHLGQRPPFSPNGHDGAPWLGDNGSSTRPDGVCPQGAPLRHYNITAITVPIQETNGGVDANGNPIPPRTDNNGEIFVLNQHVAATLNGTMAPTPLAIRSDVGDCVAVTLTNALTHTGDPQDPLTNPFSKINIHIHFVQFDPQASDGVITGFSFEQAVRPDFGVTGETTLTSAAAAGATSITVADTTGLRPGISIEVGQGNPDTEVVNKITAISGNTLTLGSPLQNAHAAGERTGVEFVQYRWYSDVDDGTVFFHDHVDALHSWGHGLFGAHIIEPAGSTFHDPVTGAPIDSGPIADIYTTGSVGFGEKGDFREYVLWEHEGIRSDGSPQGCEMSSFNLLAAPLIDRDPNAQNPNNAPGPDVSIPDGVGNYSMGFTAHQEPADPNDQQFCGNIGTSNDPYVFSSVAHGDPATPLLKAYVGDPVVIRQVGLDERVGDIRVTGHRFAEERFNANGVLTDAGTAGISEKMDYVFNAGNFAGDYLYYSGRQLELESGAWGIFRVMNTLHTSGVNALEPLPDRTPPPNVPGFPTLTFTGKAPPAAPADSGSVCPGTAPIRHYDVSIFNSQTSLNHGGPGITFDTGQPGESDKDQPGSTGSWATMYALTSNEKAILAGKMPAVPLAIRANQGDCLQVTLHNDLPVDNWTWSWGSGPTRAGFNVGNVLYNPQTSFGGAIGYDPDSSVAPGGQRTYVYYVDKELGENLALNTANESSWRAGAYASVIAEPTGSVWEDPFTGKFLSSGLFADIFRPDGTAFREYVTMFSDREPLLSHSIMDYYLDSDHSYTDYNEASLTQLEGNDQHALCGAGENGADSACLWTAKSDSANGGNDPSTPLFEAYAGDPIIWRVADASGDNVIAFQVSGHEFPLDHGITGAQMIEARTLVAGETFDAYINAAGGATGATGDYEYNVGRDPIVRSGDWGILRVLPLPGGTFATTSTTTLQRI